MLNNVLAHQCKHLVLIMYVYFVYFEWCVLCYSEHQELVRQIDETDKRELREDLERELDCLVRRMEEKAIQISKLRKHQQTVSLYFRSFLFVFEWHNMNIVREHVIHYKEILFVRHHPQNIGQVCSKPFVDLLNDTRKLYCKTLFTVMAISNSIWP